FEQCDESGPGELDRGAVGYARLPGQRYDPRCVARIRPEHVHGLWVGAGETCQGRGASDDADEVSAHRLLSFPLYRGMRAVRAATVTASPASGPSTSRPAPASCQTTRA